MTKAFRQEGKSIEISGAATTVAAGSVYRRTGNQGGAQDSSRAFVGVVTDEITGTSADATTLDGRPTTKHRRLLLMREHPSVVPV